MKKNKKGIVYFALILTLIVAMVFIFGCAGNGGNGDDEDDFKPPILDAETDRQIKQTIVKIYGPPEDFEIRRYYGTYNGYVMIVPFYSGLAAVWEVVIDGILFMEHDPGVFVWKDDNFHDLEVLFEEGLLTREDLLLFAETKDKVVNYYRNLGIHKNLGERK